MPVLSKYSPELRDIIEQPQSKIGRFVFFFLFLFIALLVLFGFIIKSPDIVIAEAKISSVRPPIVLKPKRMGRIHILTDTIPTQAASGQYLAVIDNAADWSDVQTLRRVMDEGRPLDFNLDSFSDNALQLGELSTLYYSLKNALIRYKHIIREDNEYFRRIALYSQRLDFDLKELTTIKSSYSNSLQQFEIKEKQHKEDSLLFVQNAITESQYEESCLSFLNAQKLLIAGRGEITSKERSINENGRQIESLKQEYSESLDNIITELEARYRELMAQISVWEDEYVIQAPSQCLIEWAGIIADYDYVEIGEPIFNCVFSDNYPYAVAILPGQMSGKVKEGQVVNLKLDSYPYTEYGIIKGKVDRLSRNSVGKGYLLYISLPNGLVSTVGQSLAFAETVYAQAEIITEDRRLITRIYHQIYRIISSRKKIEIDESTNDSDNLF